MQIAEVLEKFLGQLTADGRSRHTIRQYRRHVRTLAVWAAEVGHSGRVSAITDEDLATFLASPQARIGRLALKREKSVGHQRARLPPR